MNPRRRVTLYIAGIIAALLAGFGAGWVAFSSPTPVNITLSPTSGEYSAAFAGACVDAAKDKSKNGGTIGQTLNQSASPAQRSAYAALYREMDDWYNGQGTTKPTSVIVCNALLTGQG